MKADLRSPAVPPSPSFVSAGPGASGKDSTPTVVPGILGGSVTFPLNISVDTEFEHVAWNGPQGALALATAERKIFVTAKSYRDRLTISLNSYSLSLSNLTLEDAGSYKAQINWKTSKFTTDKEFKLHVYGEFQRASVDFYHVFIYLFVMILCIYLGGRAKRERESEVDSTWGSILRP